MQRPRILIPALIASIAWSNLAAFAADEPQLTAEDIQTLLRRLESAESTIGDLQQQLQEVKETQYRNTLPNATPLKGKRTATVTPYDDKGSPPLRRREERVVRRSEKAVLLPDEDVVNGFDDEEPVFGSDVETFSVTADEPELDVTYDERLAALEAAWKEQQALEIKKEKASAGKPTLKINGRIHADQWSFTDDSQGIHFFENPTTGVDPEDRFFFRRIRLSFQGTVYDNMLYRMQIDFNTPDSPEMKDVYVGWENLPVFGTVLVGNQKRPLGLDHLNSSRFNLFMERPLVVEAFNEDARRFGIAAYNVSDDEVYHWRYGAYALENMVRDGEVVGDSRQWSVNGRLSSSPWYDECSGGRGYFHWAVAGMVARPDGDVDPNDTNANEGRFRTRSEIRSTNRWLDTGRIAGAQWYEILAAESILNIGALQFVGELQGSWMQRDNTTAGTGPDVFFHGGYVYAAYMLTGEHVPYDRRTGTIDRIKPFENFFMVRDCDGNKGTGWGAWQIALRYSHLDLSDNDIRGGVEDNLTLGLVWYFNSYSSLQFNAVYGDISNHAPVNGFTGGDFTAIGTRLRINF